MNRKELIELLEKYPGDENKQIRIISSDTRVSGGSPADWFGGEIYTKTIIGIRQENIKGEEVICLDLSSPI